MKIHINKDQPLHSIINLLTSKGYLEIYNCVGTPVCILIHKNHTYEVLNNSNPVNPYNITLRELIWMLT